MPLGELITRWTIRLAMACYGLFLAGRIAAPEQSRRSRWWRVVYTAGLVLFLAHVAAAFHHYHGWSHARAYSDTAQQTEELLGFRFGGGIYVNYLFAVVWMADVISWWMRPDRYAQRQPCIDWSIQGFLIFIAFNGLIVFKAGATRWAALVAVLLLACLAVVAFGKRRLRSEN